MLKVNEIFYSIQGEGANTGIPAVFIRLSGCNLSCDFCDTQHQKYKMYEVVNILNKVDLFKCKNIVITGGEPLLQDIYPLVHILHSADYYICLETNGTIQIKNPHKFDWITVSPKENQIQETGNELKLVYIGQDLKQYEGMGFDYFFLQPCSMSNIKETVQAVLDNPKWRLSLQCQKLINIK